MCGVFLLKLFLRENKVAGSSSETKRDVMCKSAVFAVILAVGVSAGARTGKCWSFVTRSAGGACPPAVVKPPYHPTVFEISLSPLSLRR